MCIQSIDIRHEMIYYNYTETDQQENRKITGGMKMYLFMYLLGAATSAAVGWSFIDCVKRSIIREAEQQRADEQARMEKIIRRYRLDKNMSEYADLF